MKIENIKFDGTCKSNNATADYTFEIGSIEISAEELKLMLTSDAELLESLKPLLMEVLKRKKPNKNNHHGKKHYKHKSEEVTPDYTSDEPDDDWKKNMTIKGWDEL